MFVNEEEKAQWLKKSEDQNFNQYLGKEISEQDFDGCIKPHHGLAFVNNAGNVNVSINDEEFSFNVDDLTINDIDLGDDW